MQGEIYGLLRASFYHGAKIRNSAVLPLAGNLLGSAFPKPCECVTGTYPVTHPVGAGAAPQVRRRGAWRRGARRRGGAGAGRRNRLDLAVQLDFRHISYILQKHLPKKFQKTSHLVKI